MADPGSHADLIAEARLMGNDTIVAALADALEAADQQNTELWDKLGDTQASESNLRLRAVDAERERDEQAALADARLRDLRQRTDAAFEFKDRAEAAEVALAQATEALREAIGYMPEGYDKAKAIQRLASLSPQPTDKKGARVIAGIDVSTRQVAIVLLDEQSDEATDHICDLHPGGSFMAACSVREVMPVDDYWMYERVQLVGIEDPMGRSMRSVKALGLITGAVLSCLPLSVTALSMPPTEWKRETVGNPMATKPEVAAWVGRTWTNIPAVVDQDTLDAFAIAYAARAVNGRAVEAAG